MRHLRLVLVVLVGALALSSCSLVVPNNAPNPIASSKVPFGLLNKTIPGTNHARVRFITQPVFIVDVTGHLAPSSRIVPSPPALGTVIEQLLLGPSAIEKSAGYSSALPRTMVLVSAKVRHEVGYLNFASSLDALSKRKQLLAIGQLVLTGADAGAEKGIVIKVAGVTQHLLLPSGQRTEVATEGDFESLLNS